MLHARRSARSMHARYVKSPPRIIVSLQSFQIPDDPIGELFDGLHAANRNCGGADCVDRVCNASVESDNGGVAPTSSTVTSPPMTMTTRPPSKPPPPPRLLLSRRSSWPWPQLRQDPMMLMTSADHPPHTPTLLAAPPGHAVGHRVRRSDPLSVSLVYESLSGGNMLTPAGIALMHRIESEVDRFASSRGERPRCVTSPFVVESTTSTNESLLVRERQQR